jgi:hypothetical protein
MEMSFKSLPLGVLPKRGVQADRVMREHHPKPEALTASLGYHLQNVSSPQGAPFTFLFIFKNHLKNNLRSPGLICKNRVSLI